MLGQLYVSKLDLLKGYWQVPLTERASEISAFVTLDEFLQYKVLAFGLRNAPTTFQRLMNQVLDIKILYLTYLDDVLVYPSASAQHMHTLKIVFKRLCEAAFTLNQAKCKFGTATVTYLGKQVGQGQVRPVQDKVRAIDCFPIPHTRCKLRHFLGMAGYYRAFCRNQMSNKNQRLMSWSLLVQGFPLVNKHKRGVDNVLADALFRV